MAMTALTSAATGLTALNTELDVIANNLANVNTVGFKASRVNFQDLLYEIKAQPGAENVNGDLAPAGIEVGLGTRVSNTQLDLTQGRLVPTENDLGIAIDGDGFFQVRTLDDVGDGVGYTRAGNFMVNRDGEIVLGNTNGPRLIPPMQIDPEATQIEVSQTGLVTALVDGQAEEVGQLELATFVNPQGLVHVGGNLFIESAASGPPIVAEPGEAGFGSIIHKFTESSNVDPVKELVSLIKTQRAFEMNSQTIQAADETLQVVSNLRRF